MSRLYLHCVICSRRQADGLISGAAWGRLELPQGVQVEHPAFRDSTFRACPSCCTDHPDWQERVLSSFGLSAGFGLRPGPAR
ncbi:MAG: hypothetical protein H0U82_08285 [Actinobacteria bacterium]|nr:hypothetical protein [Actinomycetota bacterium]